MDGEKRGESEHLFILHSLPVLWVYMGEQRNLSFLLERERVMR